MKIVRAVRMRLPGLCMSRTTVRVRVRSPASHHQEYKQQNYNSIFSEDHGEAQITGSGSIHVKPPEESTVENGNRVMVVVDLSLDVEAALQWSLSHTVQNQEDTIILLLVNKQGSSSCRRERAQELLCCMKDACQMAKPGVHVEMATVEGKEKGETILGEARERRVSLLVLGQRKQQQLQRWMKIMMIWRRKRRSRGSSKLVEHCIQNSNCLTIAVRRKSSSSSSGKHGHDHGGYLITTKQHKNFWLLA